MKVYVLPADAHGCGHYRLIWPVSVLKRQGFDVTVMPPNEKSGFLAKTRDNVNGSRDLVSVTIPNDADVIVLQRPAHPLQPEMIRTMRDNGIAVVVDMDDDMGAIDPGNVAFHMYRTTSRTQFSWRHAAASCREATLVTTTTRALQRTYAAHGRGVQLDNYVPKAYLSMESPDCGTLGWAGTTKSHSNDLQILGRSLQRLIRDGHNFTVVGGASKVREFARLDAEPEYTGTVGITDWARIIAERLSVGLVPLAPTSFNSAKSRLKGIEYMSVGVPFVASPREEYRRLFRESGCGLYADTPKEWYQQVSRLMADSTLRKEQAEAGREYMQDQTYEANAWRWAEAWTKAYEMEQK